MEAIKAYSVPVIAPKDLIEEYFSEETRTRRDLQACKFLARAKSQPSTIIFKRVAFPTLLAFHRLKSASLQAMIGKGLKNLFAKIKLR